MKKLVAGLLGALCLSSAQAVEYSMPNKAGGEIRLTEAKCPDRGRETWNIVYTYASGGSASYGCWFFKDGMVHIRWNEGDSSIFSADSFREVKRNQPKGNGV